MDDKIEADKKKSITRLDSGAYPLFPVSSLLHTTSKEEGQDRHHTNRCLEVRTLYLYQVN